MKDFWFDVAMVVLTIVVLIANPTSFGLVVTGLLLGMMVERYAVPWLAKKIVQRRVRRAQG